MGAYLGRRPEKRELFSERLRLPEGASVGAEYFRRAADAAGPSSLKDMAGIVVNGLTQQSIEEDFVRTILRRASELSRLEALHLKHLCLAHWSKNPEAQRKLEIEHPEVFGASASPIGPEETYFRRTMALRRLENGGYLESFSHPKKPGDQGPFYKPTELTRRMYLLIDDPDLPHETVTWRRD